MRKFEKTQAKETNLEAPIVLTLDQLEIVAAGFVAAESTGGHTTSGAKPTNPIVLKGE